MITSLKNHPFGVEAFFDYSIVLTFAFHKEELSGLIPECLTLDTFNDKWAFLAVAIVQTKNLRPMGFPKILGNDFVLIGYRVFVRYTNIQGRKLRGLYILKSQTDNKNMEYLGNMFTHYNYETTDIQQIWSDNTLEIKSTKSDFKIQVGMKSNDIMLPINSPFANWKEARRFAGPLPFTFSYNKLTKKVLIIEGERENWTPQPLQINHYSISFLDTFNESTKVLANAFFIKDVPYRWKKGREEQWNK